MQFNCIFYLFYVCFHSYVCSRLVVVFNYDETMNINFSQEDISNSGPLFKGFVKAAQIQFLLSCFLRQQVDSPWRSKMH